MAGGLLNLIAVGNQNTIIHGDPQKKLFLKLFILNILILDFKKFRIDYNGIRFFKSYHRN